MMSDLAIFLGCTAAILLILGIGGLIADYRSGESVWFRHYGFTWEETGIMPPDRWAPMPK